MFVNKYNILLYDSRVNFKIQRERERARESIISCCRIIQRILETPGSNKDCVEQAKTSSFKIAVTLSLLVYHWYMTKQTSELRLPNKYGRPCQ